MTLRSLVRVAACGLAMGALYTACPATAADSDPVVARVNGTEIHRSEVLHTITGLPAQVRQMPTEMVFPAVLDQMVNGRLVAAAASEAKLQDDPEYKDKMKRAEERVIQEIFLSRAVKARITDAALQDRYKKYLTDNPPQDEVRASHILVATEAEAKGLIDQIKAGADFAKLAKEKSSDAAAAAQGGDLGYFTKDAMVQPFSEAAFAGTPGKIIETPVHTQFGWHVIRVDDRRKTTPAALDDVRAELESDLSQETVTKIVGDLRAKAKIEEFRQDGSPLPKDEPKK